MPTADSLARSAAKPTGFSIKQTPFYQAPPKAAMGPASPGYGVLTSSPAAGTSRTAGATGGGGGGTAPRSGGGGGGGGGTAPFINSTPFGAGAAPAAPPAMSQNDFLNSDDVYLAALSRYNKTYDDLLADITRRDKDYGIQYENSLDDLGYIDPGQGGGQANWDFANQQTAAGRGNQALLQDFAARGLLHSGDYLGAQNDFVAQLGKQLQALQLGKQQFGEGLNQERSTGMTSRDGGIGQARAEALARFGQLYGAV